MLIRHGDLLLRKIPELFANIGKPADTNVIITGSNNNDHIVENGKLFFVASDNPYTIGYLIANDKTRLLHKDHGEIVEGSQFRQIKIPAGVYELRRQVEYTHEGMRQVMD